MPYLVQLIPEMSLRDYDGGQRMLNELEAEGWVLVQVLPAYLNFAPQYIFHKPVVESLSNEAAV